MLCTVQHLSWSFASGRNYIYTCTVKGTYIYIYISFWHLLLCGYSIILQGTLIRCRRGAWATNCLDFWKFNSEKGRREMGKVEILFKWIQFCGSFSLCIYSRESYIDVPSILYQWMTYNYLQIQHNCALGPTLFWFLK